MRSSFSVRRFGGVSSGGTSHEVANMRKILMFTPVASLEHVSHAFGRTDVLDDVSLELCGGEFVALVGPNGSGKSTLLRILVGLLEPKAGRAALFGVDPRRLKDRARLGYVPQRPKLGA